MNKIKDIPEGVFVEERPIEEFQEAGMIWWANRILHLFGWVICYQKEEGKLIRMYPARTKFRGFAPENEEQGFKMVSEYLNLNSEQLLKEAKDE